MFGAIGALYGMNKITDQRIEIKELIRDYNGLVEEYNQLNNGYRNLQRHANQQENQLHEMRAKVNSLQSDYDALNDAYDAKIEQYGKYIDSRSKISDRTSEYVHELQGKIDALQAVVDRLTEEKTELQTNNQGVETKFGNAKALAETAQKILKSLPEDQKMEMLAEAFVSMNEAPEEWQEVYGTRSTAYIETSMKWMFFGQPEFAPEKAEKFEHIKKKLIESRQAEKNALSASNDNDEEDLGMCM